MNAVTEDAKKEGLSLLQQTWVFIPNWKILGLGIAIVGALFLYQILRWALAGVRERLAKKSNPQSFRGLYLYENIHHPIAMIITALFLLSAIQILGLPEGFSKVLTVVIQASLAFSVIRLAYMAVDAAGHRFEVLAAKTSNTLDDQLAPLITRSLKILVVILGGLILLQNVGINVASLLAGLGLGGLALALAAQDTAANLFGSITIIIDRPFQIGDWVKVGDTEGHVEEIGLRSTRIRALTRSLITVPNAIMAKEKIENMGARTSRRCRHNIGVTYSTSPAKILEFMEHIRYVITQHPATIKEDITVTFNQFADSWLNVLVNFYVVAEDTPTELRYQQEILIQIMQIAEHDQVDFAFPSRTVYLNSPSGVTFNPAPPTRPA